MDNAVALAILVASFPEFFGKGCIKSKIDDYF
jgi:hypothetical protein